MNSFAVWLRRQFDGSPEVKAKAIASAAKISESYLSGLRSGRRNERPSRERATQIAEAFALERQLTAAETQALVEDALRALDARDGAPVASPFADGSDRLASRLRDGEVNVETWFEAWRAHAG